MLPRARHAALLAAAALGIVVGCRQDATAPAVGSIAVLVAHPASPSGSATSGAPARSGGPVAAPPFADSVIASISGPIERSQASVPGGTVRFSAVPVGSYTVSLRAYTGDFLVWDGGTTVTVSAGATAQATIGVLVTRLHQPQVQITGPVNEGGSVRMAASATVTVSGTADDFEDGNLTDQISWSSSLHGDLGTGGSVTTSLSAGSHVITASVLDQHGFSDAASVTIVVDGPPTVTILAPSRDTTVMADDAVTLVASVELPAGAGGGGPIMWTSDLVGSLGIGASVTSTLQNGVHTIEARAADSFGQEGADTVTVTVEGISQTASVTLSVDKTNLAENGSDNPATATATLTQTASQTVTVTLGFSGTATLASDYAPTATQITIPAGSTSGSVMIDAMDDSSVEPNETVIVDIAAVSAGAIEATPAQQITVTIIDDDVPTVTLTTDKTSLAENGSDNPATVTATLSQAASQTVTVTLGFSGTATPTSDYTQTGTQITIPAGSTSGSVMIDAMDDSSVEVNETVIVDIAAVSAGATEATPAQQVTVTIIDDDVAAPTATYGPMLFENFPGDNLTGPGEIWYRSANGQDTHMLTTNNGRTNKDPEWSPDGTKIVFTSNRNDPNPVPVVFQIFTMDANGNNQVPLAASGQPDRSPSWSPDGTKIAFARYAAIGGTEVWVMNDDGGSPSRLTITDGVVVDNQPNWYGSRIVFTSNRTGQDQIWVMNSDGSGQTNLSNSGSSDRWPAWSPDGNMIAFTSDRDGDDNIYIMDADGNNQVRVTSSPSNERQPAWTPDGKIVFQTARDGVDWEIYIINVNGTEEHRLTTMGGPNGHPSVKRQPN